jgi:hypothetical protein
MTRVIHPATYTFGDYFLVCPDCGRVRWRSGTCRGCGVRLIGPWNRTATIDETRRTWVIAADGHAQLHALEAG